MLATSTHDTKRSEGLRARIALLSEMPDGWAEAAVWWRALNRRYRTADLPDATTEWMLYQTLVGAWPISVDRVLGFWKRR